MRSASKEACLGWKPFTIATGPQYRIGPGRTPASRSIRRMCWIALCQQVLYACGQYQIPDFSPHITLKKAECPDPTECDSFRAEISEYLTDDCGMRRKLEFLCTGINLWHNKRWHVDPREEFGFKDVSNADTAGGDEEVESWEYRDQEDEDYRANTDPWEDEGYGDEEYADKRGGWE
ncbi:hypothetical protein B0H14DRAFT_2870439 [Mycena olivaceomarginata]|nr:hypothetical protein B0H14DRAFT_2870439 [Mycena olivaceomarginata]